MRTGGNALDAAIATNLVLGAVTPYHCGYGGDLFAILWAEGAAHGYLGSGRAPAAATLGALRRACNAASIPLTSPHSVTVPGAVEGWFALLDRFGSRSFRELAQPAIRLAREGFTVSAAGAARFGRVRDRHRGEAEWMRIYGDVAAGERLVQADLARTIETIADGGPDAYYRGEIADAIVGELRARGSFVAAGDLAVHRGEWAEPLRARYRGAEVLELPPPTQGVTALEALRILDGMPLPPDGADRHHLLIEACKIALADRDAFVTDPQWMKVEPGALLSDGWVDERRRRIDPQRAGSPVARAAVAGGTAFMCAADARGMLVGLIQSNWTGFGCGITVPGWGINLHNRGNLFSLDPADVNAVAPLKRTLHTLIPALVLADGRPRLVFGSMGGHGQAQVHVQSLARMLVDGLDPQAAIDAPRWVVTPGDWTVTAEGRFDEAVLDRLRARGHHVVRVADFDSSTGHAQAIRLDRDGYSVGTDPRTEGAALGL